MGPTRRRSDRLPGWRWWARAVAAAVAVAALTGYAASRFDIRIDPQQQRSLPDARVFLVDRHDRDVGRGDWVAFAAPDLEPLFAADAVFVKRVAAEAGARVTVGRERSRVGTRTVAAGLAAAERLGAQPAHFVRTEAVPADALWVVAPGRYSVDSRYWGPLDRERVLGRAYVLF